MDKPVTSLCHTDADSLYEYATQVYGRLRLPEVPLKIRMSRTTKEMDVYDVQRRKWVALTPEEWVRQHFVSYLSAVLGFSRMRIANEVALSFNNMNRRADTVVYDDFLRPLVVVEYKAPDIDLSHKVLEQALLYNLVFEAPGVMITNGLDIVSVVGDKAWRGVIRPSDVCPGS